MYMLPVSRVRLGAMGQDEIFVEDYGAGDYTIYEPTAPAPAPAPAPSAGGETNWTGIFETAIRTWGQTQQPVIVPTVPGPYTTRPLPLLPRYGSQYPQQPGYSPFPGGAGGSTFLGMTTGTWLIIAALGAGAWYLMRR